MKILDFFKRKPQKTDNSRLPAHLIVGKRGEEEAEKYMIKQGFRVIYRNYRVGKGEIDLVMEDKEYFVFVEVKARIQEYGKPSPYGRPASAVTPKKQQLLLRTASGFCKRRRNTEKHFRFDVIEIYFHPDLTIDHLHHIKNAFTR